MSVFEDGTHLSIDPCTSDFIDIFMEQAPIGIEPDRNCLNCKHLVANDDTDTWLRVGEISYYCNNEDVNINSNDLEDGYLDPDHMEDYAENCIGFEENDELQAIAKSNEVSA